VARRNYKLESGIGGENIRTGEGRGKNGLRLGRGTKNTVANEVVKKYGPFADRKKGKRPKNRPLGFSHSHLTSRHCAGFHVWGGRVKRRWGKTPCCSSIVRRETQGSWGERTSEKLGGLLGLFNFAAQRM